MQTSKLSQQLWEESLQCLKQQDIIGFLKALERLRAEVFEQLATSKKKSLKQNIQDYYEAIYTAAGVNRNTLSNFVSKSHYRLYFSVAHYIVDKTVIEIEEIYEGETTVERSTHLTKAMITAESIAYFLPSDAQY